MKIPRAKWKVGDKVKVWAGRYEGLTFRVHDARWTEQSRWAAAGWEYLCGTLIFGGWEREDNLVDVSDRRGWHYDRAGYCDNPARGY